MDAEGGIVVFVVVALHRTDEANVIHAFAQVREKVAHRRATLAARAEFPSGLEQDALLIRKAAADARDLSIGRE